VANFDKVANERRICYFRFKEYKMKVHLVRSSEYNTVEFDSVLDTLKSFGASIDFKALKDYTIQYKDKNEIKNWEEFFGICNDIRKSKKIPNKEYVFILTSFKNSEDYFGFTDDTLRNYFIQTSQWEEYFEENIKSQFPICYEVMAWILRSQMFETKEEILHHAHQQAIGCIMDFCDEKVDIALKMRTADVCNKCLRTIGERNIKTDIVGQVFNLMEGIRKSLLFRERFEILNHLSRINLTLYYNQKIRLTDIENQKVPLNVIETAIYALFLKHSEGISLTSMFEYKNEFIDLYRRIKGENNSEKLITIYSNNLISKNLDTRISKIKSSFVSLIGERMADHYIIQKLPDGKHGIKLNRDLVQITD
jgi:hypothetical protein